MSLARWLLRHSFVRFAVIGTFGYFVAVAVLTFTTGPLKLEFAAANALTIFISMAFTWLGNRYFTFRDRRAHGLGPALQEWLKFMGANLLGAALNYGTALALVRFAGFPFSEKYLAQAAGVLAGLVFNFTLSRTMVFKTPVEPG
jgi:putative flippase GtrA